MPIHLIESLMELLEDTLEAESTFWYDGELVNRIDWTAIRQGIQEGYIYLASVAREELRLKMGEYFV